MVKSYFKNIKILMEEVTMDSGQMKNKSHQMFGSKSGNTATRRKYEENVTSFA